MVTATLSLRAQWEGKGGSLSSCGPMGLVASSPPGNEPVARISELPVRPELA